jgi:hypothetical protein
MLDPNFVRSFDVMVSHFTFADVEWAKSINLVLLHFYHFCADLLVFTKTSLHLHSVARNIHDHLNVSLLVVSIRHFPDLGDCNRFLHDFLCWLLNFLPHPSITVDHLLLYLNGRLLHFFDLLNRYKLLTMHDLLFHMVFRHLLLHRNTHCFFHRNFNLFPDSADARLTLSMRWHFISSNRYTHAIMYKVLVLVF